MWGRDPDGVRFDGPNGITVDDEGLVYVTDFRGGSVRRFTSDGQLSLEAAALAWSRGSSRTRSAWRSTPQR